MPTTTERGRTTREQLIATATRLFGEHGYERTSIEAVLKGSGVSRGALYHHFDSKDALFEAVFETMETDAAARTVAASRGIADPSEALRVGCQAWVRLAGDPVLQQVILIDAPSVLGWSRWRQIESQHGLGLLRGALQAIADSGRLPADLVDLFAHMLLAAINEIALVIARADDTDTAIDRGEAAVDELLRRLLG